MPKASPAVVNFNGGEVGALMSGRVDYDKFDSTCYRMRRFTPTVQGPAKRTPGTRHVLPVKDSSKRVWLERFEFGYDDAYILEFGDAYVRFFTDRGTVLEATQVVSGVSAASTGVLTYVGADPTAGQWFYLSGIVGMTELNGRYVMVGTVDGGANTFTLLDTNGDAIDTSGYTAYASGGTMARVYTVVSPYPLAALTNGEGGFALDITQSGDVLYIGCPGYQPRTLTRTSSTSWAFATYDPPDGPLQKQPETNKNFVLGANTGSTSLTCSTAVFESAMVGTLIRLEPVNLTTKAWEPAKAYSANDLTKSDGKIYKATNSKTSGESVPIHEEGISYDGQDGVSWQFQNAGYIVCRISAYTSTTVVTVTVIGPGLVAPAELVGGSTECRYRIGAWGTHTGAEWPSKVAFWRDRLWWGGERAIYGSTAGGYDSHEPNTLGEVLADNAINLQVAVGSNDKIRWLRGSTPQLLIGTAGGEVGVREVSGNQAFGPENCKFEPLADEGSREVAPVRAGDAILYARVGGRKLMELAYDDRGVLSPRDLNVLYPEITRSGIVDMAYAKEPDDINWIALGNGKLIGLTYDREQNVYGWHQQPLGGTDALVEAVEVIAGPAGDVHDVWCSVARTIDGETRRHIEYFTQAIEETDDIEGGCYLDSSLEYDGAVSATLTLSDGDVGDSVTCTAGSAVFAATDVGREIRVRFYDEDATPPMWRTSRAEITSYTSTTVVHAEIISEFLDLTIASGGWRLTTTELRGFWHLEGETPTLLADGATVQGGTVVDGVLTLTDPAARVQGGLPYTSTLATQRIEAGAADGTAQGKVKRIHRLVMRLYESLGGFFGPNASTLDELQYRRGSDYQDEIPPTLTGDTDAQPFPGGYETDGRIWIVCEQPLPMTVVALYPQLSTSDR